MKSIFDQADQHESEFFAQYEPSESNDPVFASEAYISNIEQTFVKYDLTLHKNRNWFM